MSQANHGEIGGSGCIPPQSSTMLFQQPILEPNFIFEGGQNYIVSNLHKANTFQMEYRMPIPRPPQLNGNASHLNQPQQMNAMQGNVVNYAFRPFGNIQYFRGGNYVTTVTVNRGDQYQNQLPVPNMQSPMNFVMNYGPPNNNGGIHMMRTARNDSFDNHEVVSCAKSFSDNINQEANLCTPDEMNSKMSEQTNSKGNRIFTRNKNVRKNNSSSRNATRSTSTATMNENIVQTNCSNSAISLRVPTSTDSVNFSNNYAIRPRTNSRCDSSMSEMAESRCSSQSSENVIDPNHANHHNRYAFAVKNSGDGQQFYMNDHPYLHNQALLNNFNNRNTSQSNQAKPGILNDGNVFQTFQQFNAVQQHLQVQNEEGQTMQQQYRTLQGRQQGCIVAASGISEQQSNMTTRSPTNPKIQQQNAIPNAAPLPEHNPSGPVYQNSQQNCFGAHPVGHFPQQDVVVMRTPRFPPFFGMVVVPFGWKRINVNGQIIYVSPSGSVLRSVIEVCKYLTQENTCKCGLQCPLRIENTFCFDSKVPHRLTMPDELSSGEATKMCNHRRKLALAFSDHLQKQAKKEVGKEEYENSSSSVGFCRQISNANIGQIQRESSNLTQLAITDVDISPKISDSSTWCHRQDNDNSGVCHNQHTKQFEPESREHFRYDSGKDAAESLLPMVEQGCVQRKLMSESGVNEGNLQSQHYGKGVVSEYLNKRKAKNENVLTRSPYMFPIKEQNRQLPNPVDLDSTTPSASIVQKNEPKDSNNLNTEVQSPDSQVETEEQKQVLESCSKHMQCRYLQNGQGSSSLQHNTCNATESQGSNSQHQNLQLYHHHHYHPCSHHQQCFDHESKVYHPYCHTQVKHECHSFVQQRCASQAEANNDQTYEAAHEPPIIFQCRLQKQEALSPQGSPLPMVHVQERPYVMQPYQSQPREGNTNVSQTQKILNPHRVEQKLSTNLLNDMSRIQTNTVYVQSNVPEKQIPLQSHIMQDQMQHRESQYSTAKSVATKSQMELHCSTSQMELSSNVAPQKDENQQLTMDGYPPLQHTSKPMQNHLHSANFPNNLNQEITATQHSVAIHQHHQQQFQTPLQAQRFQYFVPQNHHVQSQQQVHLQQTTPMQQQQQIYQNNPNQNWYQVFDPSKMATSSNGCYGPVSPQSCGAGSQFPCQNPHGCKIHNRSCFSGHRNSPCMRPTGMYGILNRPSFYRAPNEVMFRGMAPSQGGCLPHPHTSHQMMNGMKLNHSYVNNNNTGGCRMPVHSANLPLYGNQGIDGSNALLDPKEDREKRRRGGGGRNRKKAKVNMDTNSPCPTVDTRNVGVENTGSPRMASSYPFSVQSPSPNTDTLVTSTCSPVVRTSRQGPPVSGPSFMEDPNGYLAQQTALLNSTMSGGAVGQFSPQAPRISPSQICPTPQTPVPADGMPSRSSNMSSTRTSLESPVVVPLPSNVPLPARASKASSNSISGGSSVTSANNTSGYNTVCSSVHSKSTQSLNYPDPTPTSSSLQSSKGIQVARAESSCFNNTYTTSSVTTTSCSSEEFLQDMLLSSSETRASSENERISAESITFECKNTTNRTERPSSNSSLSRYKIETKKMTSGCNLSDSLNGNRKRRHSSMSAEVANKPLTPGPAESCITTQSPLEMVQNIVSSIPMPTSSNEFSSLSNRQVSHQQPSQTVPEPSPSMHQALSHHVLSPQIYNMAGASGMAGLMYSPTGTAPGMLRGAGSLVVHSGSTSGSIPQGVIVSNSGNMVVVTSPFNSKVNITTPVTCINSVVGMHTGPQVQVQPSIGHVQPHHLQPHLQQLQPIQPVVQLVNTFATMQAPVIIQNGSNIIQSPSGVISSHGGVIGPASLIPGSGPTFVTSQPILAVDSSTQSSSQVQMTQVVTSAGNEFEGRSTPVAALASRPALPRSTPGSSGGSDTTSSGGSGGAYRKRKRRRNASNAQVSHLTDTTQHPNIMPAIIMGKQIPQHVMMSSGQISQVPPYSSVTGAQVATVSAVGSSSGPSAAEQMLNASRQSANSINVVQMVGAPVAGPLPVHLQQPSAIIVPSATSAGLIINQLSDGSFVSTDPNSGVTYPVHLQLSGSHIVGVTPLGNSSSTNQQSTMVAVRQPSSQNNSANTKLINLSPNITSSQGNTFVHNVYGVNANPQSAVCTNRNLDSGVLTASHQNGIAVQQPVFVGNGNATLLQQKTTTIVAQQTTVVATQDGLMGTHSSVSTQTPGMMEESDVTSSDSVANVSTLRAFPTSPSHQSAEVTTTRHDEDSISTPESVLLTPPQGHSPEENSKQARVTYSGHSSQAFLVSSQEPHSVSTPEDVTETLSIVWGLHRGHQYWPARVLHQAGGEALVQWYGDHHVDTIPISSLSNFPHNNKLMEKMPSRRSRGQTALAEAIAEATEVSLLPSKGSPAASELASCSIEEGTSLFANSSDFESEARNDQKHPFAGGRVKRRKKIS